MIDVDEYITFNHIEEDDPGVPLDYAPEGIPTLSQWIKTEHSTVDSKTGGTSTVGEFDWLGISHCNCTEMCMLFL